MPDAFDHCAELVRDGRPGPLPRRRCSRRPSIATRCSRSMPSMSRSRACASWRASRCRARSGCNGGARCCRGERDGEAAAHPVAAALRETIARYRLAAAPLLELIEARTFDLYDEPMATRRPISKATRIKTPSALIAMAADILGAAARRPNCCTLACRRRLRDRRAAARLCRCTPRAGSFICRSTCWTAIGVDRERHFRRAGERRDCARRWPSCARMARQHLAAAQAKLNIRAAGNPAGVPAGRAGRSDARRMERAGYEPFAARADCRPGAGNGCCGARRAIRAGFSRR